ncbi:MarR family transcriptional regulator [Bradyrhizobium sp. BR 10289]|uniref:MarR family winged helix-turn-helix transcriptional regulator n=1 Tax=Bradyrhizobium sp. BR 10289 TaxID=2749993 RepID=UPI001C6520AC|nr:MarR family transcriptional regulator [Bradyrhizobium sp. BR 10289]MBW7968885.1 MarR family transcriptional regulator [Bradyrhizobium sp. BR 10289]
MAVATPVVPKNQIRGTLSQMGIPSRAYIAGRTPGSILRASITLTFHERQAQPDIDLGQRTDDANHKSGRAAATAYGFCNTSAGTQSSEIMPIRETVELLAQAASALQTPDNLRGLREREWSALRFLARANKFSRSPTALARYLGTTPATATQVIKTLEDKGYLARKPSPRDKRAVLLCVTTQGERLLLQHDPINGAVHAVATLIEEDRIQLRNALNSVLSRLESPYRQVNAGVCRGCFFLNKGAASTGSVKPGSTKLGSIRSGSIKVLTEAEFRCRLHRAPIAAHETELLCTSFERAGEE